MFQLRKETDYAIQFLKILSKQRGNLLSLNDAAVATGISFLFLQKIARKLRLARIIRAEKGIEGGYALAVPAVQLSLKKIIEAVEGKCGLLSCLAVKSCNCTHKECQLKKKMGKINTDIMKMFEKVKLSSL